MMATPKVKPFTTPMTISGQTDTTAAATKAQAIAQQNANIAESDARLRARIPSSPNYVAPEDEALPEGVVPGYGAGTPMTVYNQASNLEEPSYGIQTSEDTAKQFASGKTITNRVTNADGSVTLIYNDGTSEVISGTKLNTLEKQDTSMADAYERLYNEFNALGLGALVLDAKDLLMKSISISAMPDALRGTKAYTDRFSANDARIKAGLRALSPAEYLAKEDAYQNIMRNYGLPASYYKTGLYGKQEGFDKLLAGDVSAVELEDRIGTAQKRVINANPEVTTALKQFYPDITNGDILAYTLDPAQGLEGIKRKVTAAEIGGAALQSGLAANLARAEELGKYGIDKATAEKGYSTIGSGLQRGSQLAAIYQESPYTQSVAEQEIFNIPGAEEARKKRQKITGLEKATFGGQTGITSGALARDRAGAY